MDEIAKKVGSKLWPDVNDEDGIKLAIRYGVAAAVLLASVYAFVLIQIYTTSGFQITDESGLIGELTDEELALLPAIHIVFILILSFSRVAHMEEVWPYQCNHLACLGNLSCRNNYIGSRGFRRVEYNFTATCYSWR